MRYRTPRWLDKWYAHKLRLPGRHWVCNKFDDYALRPCAGDG